MNKNINNNSEVNSIRARAKQLFLYSGISFLFTLTLWCWFAFSHIAYLSAWNLSLRDAFITFFIISLLQLIVEANITKQIWHAAYPGFLATMIVFPYVIGAGSGNGIPDFQYLNPYVLASVGCNSNCNPYPSSKKSRPNSCFSDKFLHLSINDLSNHRISCLSWLLSDIWQYICSC